MTPASLSTNTTSAASLMHRFTPAQWGVLFVAAAVILGLTPRFAGVGFFLSSLLLLGGLVVWRREAGFTLVKTTFVSSPWFLPIYAGVIVAQAWQTLEMSFLSLLWTMGAGLLVVGVRRQAQKGGENAVPITQFDGRGGLLRGYGQYITLGVGLCFLSLLLKWGQTPGFLSTTWSGGFHMVSSYNYYTHSIESQMQYAPLMNLTPWYYPGFALSGRSRPYVLEAEVTLLALLAWAAFRRSVGTALAPRDKQVGFVLVGFVFLWRLSTSRGLYQAALFGPLLFFAGTVLSAVGVFFRATGQTEGRFDLAHLAGGALAKRRAG